MSTKVTLEELFDRKIVNNITSKEKLLSAIKQKAYIYCGFDPTAVSLHLGNYAQIIGLKLFEQLGLKVICVLGTGTGLIGDPSFKNAERVLLDKKVFLKNAKGIENQLNHFFPKSNKSMVLKNNDWYMSMNIIDFLRDIGKYINVSQMIHKESVSKRIESGLSFTEFSYQILQALDFNYLYEKYNCCVQMGGSDQWGNITTGVELIRKIHGDVNNSSVGLTLNLLTNEKKEKFGKSVSGAIFLDKNLTSPYKMYQFLYNQVDELLESLFCMLTLIPNNKIKEILIKHNENPSLRYGQSTLANEIVTTIHGKETLDLVLNISKSLYKTQINELSLKDLNNFYENLDRIDIDFNDSIDLKTFLLDAKVFSSNRELTEFVQNNSISINGEKVISLNKSLNDLQYLHNKFLIIKKGKHQFWIYKK